MSEAKDIACSLLQTLTDIVSDVTKDVAAGTRLQVDAVSEFKDRATHAINKALFATLATAGKHKPKRKAEEVDDNYVPKEVDPKLYRQLSQPFGNRDVAAAKLNELFIKVGQARRTAGVPDLSVVFSVAVAKEDGGEENMMGTFRFGDPLRVESLAAFLFGKAKAEREQIIAGIVDQSRTTGLAMDPRETKEAA